jgi:hypothetical protein
MTKKTTEIKKEMKMKKMMAAMIKIRKKINPSQKERTKSRSQQEERPKKSQNAKINDNEINVSKFM